MIGATMAGIEATVIAETAKTSLWRTRANARRPPPSATGKSPLISTITPLSENFANTFLAPHAKR